MVSNSVKVTKCKTENPALSSMFVCGPRSNVHDTTSIVYYQSLTGNWDAHVESFNVKQRGKSMYPTQEERIS